MKNKIVMAVVGVVLFLGSLLGLLAVQGRLNHDGTKGIPVLHSFFPEPPAEEGEEGAEGEDGGDHSEAGDPHAEAGHEQEGGEKVDLTQFHEPEKPAHETGPSVQPGEVPVVPEDRSTHGATGGDGHGVDDHPPAAPGGAAHGESSAGHGAAGTHGYRPGALFQFPKLESGMGVEELNGYVKEIEAEREAIRIERAALQQQRAELEARESDTRGREKEIRRLMRKITQERAALQAEMRQHEERATIVRQAEAGKFAEYAARLAAMEPTRASAILLQMWNARDPKEPANAIKILFEMLQTKKSAVDEILATVDERQAKAILDRLSSAVREGGG